MVLILIALGCGLVAATAISQVTKRAASSGEAALETIQIYVASADIDVNEQLDGENVKVEEWPKSKVPEGSITDLEELKERFARVRFYKGEPILKAKLANGIEGPAIKIPEGFRVCSFEVQMDTAVSGLVNPGDRVDIIGYFSQRSGAPETGTREILRNVRVFAVNSETEFGKDQEGRTIVAKTVSVLVEQGQVARLMLATELGTLRLALRRPNETGAATDGESATIETLFGKGSEDADKSHTAEAKETDEGQEDGQLTSAAGGFVNFLAGLKRGQQQSSDAPMPMAAMAAMAQPAGPAWQMQVLTPNGGTSFVWSDEKQLPQEAHGQTSGLLGASSAPVTFVPTANGSGGEPAADGMSGAASGGTSAEPQEETQREQEQGETDQGQPGD
jgi:pilus assembly protein CpaB